MVEDEKSKSKEKMDNNIIESDSVAIKSGFEQALFCIGEYSIKIILQNYLQYKSNFKNSFFISKFSKDIVDWSQSLISKDYILSLEKNVDAHFWYQLYPILNENNILIEKFKKTPIDRQKGTIILSSLWDGFGSAIVPALITHSKKSKINSIAFGILPSQIQPSDAHFNAFSSVGLCLSKNFSPLVLLDRDNIESFVGINLNGLIIKGNAVINFIFKLIKQKKSFVQEISELTRTFNIKSYTVLVAAGASLGIYGSLEHILTAILLKPLLRFNFSSSSIIYVIIRIPIKLKKILSKNTIELLIANWLKDKVNLKSLQVSEPLYEDSNGDRIDLAVFIGGFDLKEIFSLQKKKIESVKNNAFKKSLIKKEEWEAITKELN